MAKVAGALFFTVMRFQLCSVRCKSNKGTNKKTHFDAVSIVPLYARYNRSRSTTLFGVVTLVQPNTLLGLAEIYKKDQAPKKTYMGGRPFYDEDYTTWVLSSARISEKAGVKATLDKECWTIISIPKFNNMKPVLTLKTLISEKNVASVASARATGVTDSVHLDIASLGKIWPYNKSVYISNPKWPNDGRTSNDCCFRITNDRWFNSKIVKLNSNGVVSNKCNTPIYSIIILQVRGHNPAGIDSTTEHWSQIPSGIKKRQFFDKAYLDFASGNCHSQPLQDVEESCNKFIIAQRPLKNESLDGERLGACHFNATTEKANRVTPLLKVVKRGMQSSSPLCANRIGDKILNKNERCFEWVLDVNKMGRSTIITRKRLRNVLAKLGYARRGNHINYHFDVTSSRDPKIDQVRHLRRKFHIRKISDGHLALAALSKMNVEYVGEATREVT